MKSDSGKEGRLIRNPDVRAEFEKIMKDQNLIKFWRNYIRGRLNGSIISQYERNTTEDDILSRLEMKIYDRGMEWNRNVYKTFKHFMYGKIQNIIRNKEASLTIRYENYLIKEELGKVEFIAKPMTYPETARARVEINLDRIQNGLDVGEDKYAYYSPGGMKESERIKFNAQVQEILKDPKDTDLLAIFTEIMHEKERKEIIAEYGMSDEDYDKAYKKLKYRLKKHLPAEYKKKYTPQKKKE